MNDDAKPKNRWRRLIGIVCSLVSLVVLTYIAVSLISGQPLGMSWITDIFSDHEPVVMADEYHFDVGRARVFADLGGSLAAAGTLGVQVLDAEGDETLRDSFRMSSPAIDAQNGRAIVFDIGGKFVRVIDKTEIDVSFETNGVVIAASINQNGWFCVCTQEGGGSRGLVTVYNEAGKDVFMVNMVTGYVLSAALSPDNRNLVVLNLTGDGSRITYYSLNNENAERVFDLPGGLIIDMWYLPGGDVLAVSTDSLILAGRNNTVRELYGFSGKRLGGYARGNGFIALHLFDYGVGHRGRIVTISDGGRLLGELETDIEILSISAGDGYLAVLRSDSLLFYDDALEELAPSGKTTPTGGATQVLALGGSMALAAGDHSAVVCAAAPP